METSSASDLLALDARRRAARIWAIFPRRPALPWTGGVSYRIGAAIAALVLPFHVSPNALTLSGLVMHAIGATILIAQPTSPPAAVALLVLVIWQVAFGFDCADGLVARATGRESGYGAWLDQVVDVGSHGLVYLALTITAARALDLDHSASVGLAVWTLGTAAMLGHAAGLKGYTIGTSRSLSREAQGVMGWLSGLLFLTDYGLVLAVASVLVLVPAGLAAFLVAEGAACLGAVTVQAWMFARPPRG